ncbi:hypothetical protein [Asinibacterium sp. OR53]|uniref:hypothetical protein n=1 Tax=Asinibacterium sp. OR53 TaxID=925409 RepID=UPI00047AD9D5|nr:hypothetical protein [Asinibacterium sp. OR53]
MTKNPATPAVLLAFPMLLIFLSCSNNGGNMKYEKTNAGYQVDSTSSSKNTMDTAVVAKPVTKPGSATPSTVDHVDTTAKKSIIPGRWETVRLRRKSFNRTGEAHTDSLVLLVPADTVAHPQPTGSGAQPPTEKIGKRSGILGYSFFKQMKRSETKNIHAFISIRHSESALRDTIRIINAQEEPNKRNDTVSIFTQNILLYRYVDVRLLDPDHSFTIAQVHDSARQEVDETDGNHWEWAVTPNTDRKEARLILKVVAEKPDEPAEPFDSRTIPITINVNTNIVRPLWIYLYDHPEYVFTAILIPVVAYFGKKIFDRRKSS